MEGTVHERFMRMALRLAARAQGWTAPNPMVGAVVVKGGRVLSTGYHHQVGAPHAEVEALRRAKGHAKGATLYVTLEPCNHVGRTPPCCDAILAAGITHVVVAMKDPNPITDGRGVQRLRRAGLRVTVGVLAEEAQRLNAPFVKVMRTGMPFVIAKVGQSLDGKIATRTGESRWVTSAASRRVVHRLRARVDAIMVGINTVRRDDPLLTVRDAPLRPARPLKVILDSRLRLSPRARCLSAASPTPVLIATTAQSSARQAALATRGAEVLVVPSRTGRVPLKHVCRTLAHRGVHTLLIEGGGEVLASAFAERVVDRIVWFIAPLLIGGRTAPSAVGGSGVAHLPQAVRLSNMTITRVGSDLCLEADVIYPAQGRRG